MLQRAEQPVALTGVEASRLFFAPCFDRPSSRRLWVAHVDGEARCIHLASYEGGMEAVDLPVRAIVADALRLDSAGIVLAHQGEAGDLGSAPSPNARAATRSLALAAEAIDLCLLDHLVFAGPHCTSFRRLGLL